MPAFLVDLPDGPLVSGDPRAPAPYGGPASHLADVDFAPVLHADLLRTAASGDERRVLETIGALHVLATLSGYGSREIDRPRVYAGREAVYRAQKRLDRDQDGVADAPWPRETGAAVSEAPDGARRFVVLVERYLEIDGTAGGYHFHVALAQLDVSREGWRYGWEVVYADADHGVELS